MHIFSAKLFLFLIRLKTNNEILRHILVYTLAVQNFKFIPGIPEGNYDTIPQYLVKSIIGISF